jgi:para-aminobenzoate synthetase component 1
MLLRAEKVFELMNEHGNRRQPFLFGIDFDVENGFFLDPARAGDAGIYYNINGPGNDFTHEIQYPAVKFVKYPVEQSLYYKAFDIVHRNLVEGNSYLANLTFPTVIELNLTLPEIFARS